MQCGIQISNVESRYMYWERKVKLVHLLSAVAVTKYTSDIKNLALVILYTCGHPTVVLCCKFSSTMFYASLPQGHC